MAREDIMAMISGQDEEQWGQRDQKFKSLLNQEIDILFKEPSRISN